MMTTCELTETTAQLSTAMKQINNLTFLMNARLSKSTITADIWPVHLDTTATMFKLGNQVCPVTIKMEGYNDKKNNVIEWYSKAFYTHNNGYKMCLCVDAAGYGDGKGTHLSVYLNLMKGSHDDELTWPLRGEFDIDLLNQISDGEHYFDTWTYNDIYADTDGSDCRVMEGDISEHGLGCPQFISNEDLCETTPTCQYLKDDCLFFRVTKL